MKFNRRRFLQTSGISGVAGLVLEPERAEALLEEAGVKNGDVTTTICPFCAVGCGALVVSRKGRIVHVAGDPDHPINEGALCSKGKAMLQIADNRRRLTKVRYRAPHSDSWEERDWDWAIAEISGRIKKTRDKSFRERDREGRLVNRTEGIAAMGGAALDNEECYAYSKFARSLGIVYLEHQARI